MNRYDIEKKLAEIFKIRFAIDFLGNPEMKKMKLLGKSLNIPARELLHVYFDVKKTFDISVPEDDVAKGCFDTFEHILDIICNQLNFSNNNTK